MATKTKSQTNLKKIEGIIQDACKELEQFDETTPVRIFKLTPTARIDGWLAIFIDIPIQNSPPKAETGTLATEPLNDIKESELAS
jgi:hypothetical protein